MSVVCLSMIAELQQEEAWHTRGCRAIKKKLLMIAVYLGNGGRGQRNAVMFHIMSHYWVTCSEYGAVFAKYVPAVSSWNTVTFSFLSINWCVNLSLTFS